jgi:hypothetical protein
VLAVSFLSRLVKLTGELPEELRTELVADGILLIAEHRRATLTLRHYRAPGLRSGFRRKWMRGAAIVTRNRFVICLGRHKFVDVARRDVAQRLEVTVEKPGVLCVAFDPAQFNPRTSGRVEVRLRTPEAERFVGTVTGSTH